MGVGFREKEFRAFRVLGGVGYRVLWGLRVFGFRAFGVFEFGVLGSLGLGS